MSKLFDIGIGYCVLEMKQKSLVHWSVCDCTSAIPVELEMSTVYWQSCMTGADL